MSGMNLIKDKTREVCDLIEKLTSRALGASGTILDMSDMDDDTVVMLRDTMKCVKGLDELLMGLRNQPLNFFISHYGGRKDMKICGNA